MRACSLVLSRRAPSRPAWSGVSRVLPTRPGGDRPTKLRPPSPCFWEPRVAGLSSRQSPLASPLGRPTCWLADQAPMTTIGLSICFRVAGEPRWSASVRTRQTTADSPSPSRSSSCPRRSRGADRPFDPLSGARRMGLRRGRTMRRLAATLLATCLLTASAAAAIAQEPSPPPWFGGRVEMASEGIAVTIPGDWVAIDLTADVKSQMAEVDLFPAATPGHSNAELLLWSPAGDACGMDIVEATAAELHRSGVPRATRSEPRVEPRRQ